VKAVDTEAIEEFEKGLSLLRNDYPGRALVHLTKAVELEKNNPFYLSHLGVALARAGKNWSLAENLRSQTSQMRRTPPEFDLAEKLCSRALQMNRTQPELYLNLAEVYSLAGNKEDAIETLSRGLRFTKQNEHLADALRRFGSRRRPVLRFLGRRHFLNRHFGKMRNRLLISLGKAV
jgi:Flp pilus assembly protein TadD